MQASLVRLLERPNRPDNPEAWITTVATNLALRVLRRHALEDRANSLSRPQMSDSDFVDRLVGRLLVDEVLSSLPPRQREALNLRFRVDLPQATVAEAMRLGVESVKTHIERARPKALARYEELAGEGREN
ncbi:MAG: sigma-70 family RNA polymerase sigma factor [Actinomycetota bacterium]|nr:sigma-70 family RNA polymerase sigma factor [Actinomycetota bacterium]